MRTNTGKQQQANAGQVYLRNTLFWVLDSGVYLNHFIKVVVAHVSVNEVVFDLHCTVKASFPLHIQAQWVQHRFARSTEHRSKSQLEKISSP